MMTATEKAYDDLTVESSNLMLQGDSRKALGRYEETADCYRRAGELRRSMGDAKYQSGEFESAVEDWLSAAECFVEGTSPESARSLVMKVRNLFDSPNWPGGRPDLLSVLQEREQQVTQLDESIQLFENCFDESGNMNVGSTEDTLSSLLSYRRTLPGYRRLHWAIFHQAGVGENDKLASEHLRWASHFDPTDAKIAASNGENKTRNNQ